MPTILLPPTKKRRMGFQPHTLWEIRKGLAFMMEKTSHRVLSEFGKFLRLQLCTLPKNDHICPPQRVGAFGSMIFPTSRLVGYMYPFPGGFPCIYHDLAKLSTESTQPGRKRTKWLRCFREISSPNLTRLEGFVYGLLHHNEQARDSSRERRHHQTWDA